jgi:hypothetical protein
VRSSHPRICTGQATANHPWNVLLVSLASGCGTLLTCFLLLLPLLQLRTLARLAHCILFNPHFHFIEGYLHQVLPALLTITLHSGYTDNPDDNHWGLRRYAAELVACICKRFGVQYPQLQPRVSVMLVAALESSKPLPTQYGAIQGISMMGPLAIGSLLLPEIGVLKVSELPLPPNLALAGRASPP